MIHKRTKTFQCLKNWKELERKSHPEGWLNLARKQGEIGYKRTTKVTKNIEMTMKKIEKYGIFCRSWEGGWSNHPNDKGGATMKGVTYTTFCAFRKAKGLPKPSILDLKNISDKEWDSVLRWHTWDKANLDQINDEWVTYLIADCVWMSGAGYLKRIQRILGLKDDGIIGPKSIAKINSMQGEALFNILYKQREQFLRGIGVGKNAVFLKGWLRRLNCVRHGYLLCNGGKYLR